MKLVHWLSVISLSLFFSCQPSQQQKEDEFLQLSEQFISEYLTWRPATGVYMGLHEYDGKVTDYSAASIEQEKLRLKKYDSLFNAMDGAAFSKDIHFDWKILLNAIRYELFYFEDLQAYTQNPMTYAGAMDVNIYVKRNFAPLEQRLQSIMKIEAKAQEIFAAAKANLADSLPKPHTELAIQIARGSADFLQKDLLVALQELKNDSLMAAFTKVNEAAIAAIQDYANFLEKEKLPKAHNRYALGEEKYRKMLLYSEGITLSPDEILKIGQEELKREQEAFIAAAKIIDPKRPAVDVYNDMQKEHPTAESLIPDAIKNLEMIRQFVVDKKLVTMPSEVRVKLEETPAYARSTSTASMDTPGPFEEKATEAYYYITPVDPKWTPQQQEDWLAQFNFYTTDVVSIHEAYPGHYTQFLHLNASKASKIRKIFGSYAFIEGWAHYTEKLVMDEGFGQDGDPIRAAKYRLAQSGDALLRICRLCVSINTHCHGMTVDEATKFFMDNWYQGDKPSRQEALRGTYDPGYLFYTLGKLQILKLREDYRQQQGKDFNLQQFHDQLLDQGMPPVSMLREMLINDKAKWDDIL